ncbi:MAG: YbjN domain-containing protein [Chloroflexi bacterium]|nr:YbjN domain-containing protein [Chloroflexota bacterium]OJV92571.1 MAG: hypothetical protein BGO39_32225 [Chloroflexi bacterium 54-19]
MSEIFDEVKAFFAYEDWPVQVSASEQLLETQFKGEQGQWTCYAQANEEAHQFVFYSVCPTLVPSAKRAAMAEFISRANFGLMIGNFELNFDDGEVRYKTSLDVEDTAINFNLIKNLVYANITLMDHYYGGIMKVIYSDKTAAELIEEIEN